MSADPYLDPNTGVLRNRLDITTVAELAQAEAELTSFRLIELHEIDLPGCYDLPHLQAFHRYLFADVYAWAGEIRTVSIGKGDLFCLPQHIVTFAEEVFGKFAAADYLRGRQRPAFVDGLADLLADINALHPFREGNGRTQRAFLTQAARAAGHLIRWSAMDPALNIAASQAAHRGDNSLLRALLDHLVDSLAAPSTSVSCQDASHPAPQTNAVSSAPVMRQDPVPPLPRSPGDS